MLLRMWAHMSYFLTDFGPYLIILVVSFILLLFLASLIFNSQRSEIAKKLLLMTLFSFFFLIITYCGLEALFRYRYDESDGLGFLDTNVRWMARHVVFNTYGYRDKDFLITKKPGVLRIGVVGDSLTMGYGIKDVNKRFSNLLEKKLQEKGYRVEVFNMGVSGLDTCSEITEFNRVKQLNFDLIIWEYYPNDIQPCTSSTGSTLLTKRFNSINPVLKFFLDKSFFFDYVYWKLSPTYSNTFRDLRLADLSQYTNPQIVKNHLADVASMSATLQENTTTHKVVVIIFPFLFLLNKNYPAIGIHKMISSFLIKHGNLVIDLAPVLIPKSNMKLMVNNFDSHPNEYVHAIAANMLYDKIVGIVASFSAKIK